MWRRMAIVLLSGVLASCGAPAAVPTATPFVPVKAGEAPFRDVLMRPHQRTILGGSARIVFGPDETAPDGQWSLRYQHRNNESGRVIDRQERPLVYLYAADHLEAKVTLGVVLTPEVDQVRLELTTGDIVPVDVEDGLFYLRHPVDIRVQKVTLVHRNGETKIVDDAW